MWRCQSQPCLVIPIGNTFPSLVIVDLELTVVQHSASIHLESASTTPITYLPFVGSAKSMCIRDQARSGQGYMRRAARSGAGLLSWHARHRLPTRSMTLSMSGHQTQPLARAFMQRTPGCATWSSAKIALRSLLEITTR